MIFMQFSQSEVSIRKFNENYKIQQQIANWKAEIQGFPSVEESASEDITIKSYDDFEIQQNSWKFWSG